MRLIFLNNRITYYWIRVLYPLIGLVLSLWLLKYNYFVMNDGYEFAFAGKNIINGAGLTLFGKPFLYKPPFYLITIGIFYKILGDLELAAHMVSVIAFVSSIIIFFKLAELIYNKRVSYIATFLFITNNLILEYSHKTHSASLSMLLVIISLYLACLIIKGRDLDHIHFILLGMVLAFAVLTRPENIITMVVFIITIFIFVLRKKERWFNKCVALVFFIIVLTIFYYFPMQVLFIHILVNEH